MRAVTLLLLACLPVFAQSSQIYVMADQEGWTDTNLDLRADDVVSFDAVGNVRLSGGRNAGPDGIRRGFTDLVKSLPVNNAGVGALIGRIGTGDAAIPFLVGSSKSLRVTRPGRLFLSVNRNTSEPAGGSFQVDIDFTSRGAEAVARADQKLPAITVEMLDRIPRRVVDAEGNAGDNTNFLIVGSQSKVLAAFEAAGWVQVDRSRNDAIVHSALSIVLKQAYLELPMSELMLFGRVQDYGLAHAEPLEVAARRHHLRLWKAPFDVEGQELWVGAATHDIGFDRDARNNGITHRIDPDIDLERGYVGATLDATGLVAKLSKLAPTKPSKEALTATGASFHSDGQMLVIHLAQ